MCVDMRGYVGDSGTPGMECPKIAEAGLKRRPTSSNPTRRFWRQTYVSCCISRPRWRGDGGRSPGRAERRRSMPGGPSSPAAGTAHRRWRAGDLRPLRPSRPAGAKPHLRSARTSDIAVDTKAVPRQGRGCRSGAPGQREGQEGLGRPEPLAPGPDGMQARDAGHSIRGPILAARCVTFAPSAAARLRSQVIHPRRTHAARPCRRRPAARRAQTRDCRNRGRAAGEAIPAVQPAPPRGHHPSGIPART
jgi:hypothetical protein